MRLRLIVCTSNYVPALPPSPSPSVFLVHFPPHLISTLQWFPLCSFECIIGFWWPHFFSFILVCLCSVTHIFVSPLMSMWITDEKLSVDKLVTTQNGRRHLTFWIICVGTGQLMNTWGSEQTRSAGTRGSAVEAVRSGVAGETGEHTGANATIKAFNTYAPGECGGYMGAQVVFLEPKIMLATYNK